MLPIQGYNLNRKVLKFRYATVNVRLLEAQIDSQVAVECKDHPGCKLLLQNSQKFKTVRSKKIAVVLVKVANSSSIS